MIGRVAFVLLAAYGAGFAWFLHTLALPAGPARTDAIVVPTGGPGRIERGVALLAAGAARRMLVSGVGDQVTGPDLAHENKAPRRLFACCVDLGEEAVDTRSNAEETAAWIADHRFRSLRLVTTDWHMRRSRMELDAVLPRDVRVVEDGVPSRADWGMRLREYNKFVVRRIALWARIGG